MKDIKGYEGLYAVTSCGRVWSYKSKKFLKPGIRNKGYLAVQLQGKNFLIHRLVANAYIPNPDNLETVDHIDGNTKNNCVNNLQWMSNENNIKKSLSKKIKCVETNTIYSSMMEAERQTNVPHQNISKVCNGKLKTAGGYHWEVV